MASWQGWSVRFTDGICPRCLERFREEHQGMLDRRPGAAATPHASLTPETSAEPEPEPTPRA